MKYRVGLVGHCGFDSGGLIRATERALGDVDAVAINDQQHLEAELATLHLLLVNRLLDGTFVQSTGVELIAAVKARSDCPAMLLVSNHDDAQAAARAAGASEGFGKRDLRSPEAEACIRAAVGDGASS